MNSNRENSLIDVIKKEYNTIDNYITQTCEEIDSSLNHLIQENEKLEYSTLMEKVDENEYSNYLEDNSNFFVKEVENIFDIKMKKEVIPIFEEDTSIYKGEWYFGSFEFVYNNNPSLNFRFGFTNVKIKTSTDQSSQEIYFNTEDGIKKLIVNEFYKIYNLGSLLKPFFNDVEDIDMIQLKPIFKKIEKKQYDIILIRFNN